MAKGYMSKGALVPDDLIIDIVKDRLAEEDCSRKGWLLDGSVKSDGCIAHLLVCCSCSCLIVISLVFAGFHGLEFKLRLCAKPVSPQVCIAGILFPRALAHGLRAISESQAT